jgi:hypothetical protein
VGFVLLVEGFNNQRLTLPWKKRIPPILPALPGSTAYQLFLVQQQLAACGLELGH